MDWDYFYKQLEASVNIDETYFYFSDGPDDEHYLGYTAGFDKPYWVGSCGDFGNRLCHYCYR